MPYISVNPSLKIAFTLVVAGLPCCFTAGGNTGSDAISFTYRNWEGVFCRMRIAESCQRVICGKFDADFFCEMKGKVRNESMRNVTEMNIYEILAIN